MTFDVKSTWAGALTATSFRVVADTAPPTNGSLLVADNEAMTGAVTIGPVTATIDGILAFTVTGLTPNTQYWYVVSAGGLNTSYKGTVRTHPGPVGEPLSYIFGAAGDAGLTGDGDEGYVTNGVSNSPVFDTMAAQCRTEGWAWFSHLGDLHYRNINVNDPSLYRAAYDDNHNFNLGFNPGARQGTFLRGQAITYVWDDHDFGPNDSNRTSPGRPAAQQVYRECVPHYPLADTAGIFQSWQVGRVLYIASDVRSFRDPNDNPITPAKTMLGTAQKAWMEALLTTARDGGAEALVWQSPSRWVGGSDTWSSFPYERDEMVQMFGDTGWLDRMLFMTADMHSLSMCTGPHNPYGQFPMMMFASMDAGAWDIAPGDYDIGSVSGRRQYGTLRVTDNGHTIALAGTGYHDGTVVMAHTEYLHVGNPVIALDYAAGHISEPFEPTDDDQKLRNEITASRVDGGESTYSKTDGPNNTGDPAQDADAVGVYDEGVQLNVASDAQLPDMAAWRVHLGTVDEDRYPTVRVDLAKNPGLADELTGLYLGDRVTIANPPAWLPPDVIELIAEGGTETVGHPNDWDMVLNASPGSPWKVAQLASPQTLVLGDFEASLTGWSGQNCTIARVATPGQPPFPGSWSVQITPDGTSASGGVAGTSTAVGSIIPGESYVASCWAYSPGGWSDLRAVIDWYDASGTFLSTGLGSATAVPAGQWTLLSQTLTAPASASKALVRGRHGGTPAAGNIWYADQVTLREARATGLGAGPNNPNRVDTSSSHLVSAVSSSATELVVHTPPDGIYARATWINSTGLRALFPTHFPFDVRLGGEVVRVTACAPATWDTFTRTTSNGWGTASSGQAWTTSGGTASEYSTNGTLGLHSVGSVNVSRYTVVTSPSADVDLRVDVATSALAAGGPQYLHLVARWTDANNLYAARLGFQTNQTLQLGIQERVGGTQTDLVTVTVPGVHAAGTFYTIRFQLAGTTLRAKAWPQAQPEPVKWQAIVTDTSLTAAGSVGVRSSLSSANTNTLPVTASYDNFEITTPQRMTVTRSVNTIAKAQTAGTPVSLAQPATVAL
ncbi:MAG: hypothetical protein HOZ81_10785 [Streptomyces sp.]|nr:hypothetical protein [Streptomyces sp.]NUS24264.1 hypothetical protein [Streptomyces sp.]